MDDSKLVVAVIVNRLYEWSQNFITRELCEYRRRGVELHVAARRIIEREDLTADEQKLRDHFIPIPEIPFLPSSLARHISIAFSRPVRYVRTWAHFLTFGHWKPHRIFRNLVCLFRACATAREFESRGIRLIHAHFMTAPTETAFFVSVLTGIPYGSTSHAMDIYMDNSGQKKKIKYAEYLVTETKANVRYFNERWNVSENEIHQVYNSLSQPIAPEAKKAPHSPFRFLAVGRLVPKKGFSYLLEACSLLKAAGSDFRCKLIGSGPLEDVLKKQTAELELEQNIEFVGYVAPNDMHKLYEEADALVMPSVIDSKGNRDGLPTVCMEALVYGVPLICSDVSGLPECVEEGRNGLVVPAEDGQALAEAMRRMLQTRDYEALCQNSRRVARERFDIQKNVSRIIDVMRQAVR